MGRRPASLFPGRSWAVEQAAFAYKAAIETACADAGVQMTAKYDT